MSIKIYFLLFFYLSFAPYFNAQGNYALVNVLDESKGISSEKVYDVTQDSDGFIWMATDNGVCRFDGKRFYLYSVENGLPSNEVLQIFRDRYGRIWANCYMKPLSFFNQKNNRFEVYRENQPLFNNLWIYKYNTRGNYHTFYKNVYLEILGYPKFDKNSLGYPLYAYKNTFLNFYKFQGNTLNISIYANKKEISRELSIDFKPVHTFFFFGSIYCYNDRNELYRYSILGPNFSIKTESLKIGGKISQISFSANHVNFMGKDGTVYIVDAKNFRMEQIIHTGSSPNNAFVDRDSNVWISTVDSGVLLYRKSFIKNIKPETDSKREIQSIHIEGNDIYSGNYFGEFFKNGKKISDINKLNAAEDNIRIKDIIQTSRNKILISERLIVKDLKKTIIPPKRELSAIKTSVALADDFILLGTSNGLFHYNPLNDEIFKIGTYSGRVLHFAKKEGNILFTTSNEIFQYNPSKNIIEKLGLSKYFADDFITGIESLDNGLLWVSTDRGNLYLFNSFVFFSKINYQQGISNNIKVIRAKENALYLGTHSDGLIKMNYFLNNKNLHYNIQYINAVKGLASNNINAITFKKDSVVVGTNRGISIVPVNFPNRRSSAKPIILQTKIDGKLTQNQSNYYLKNNQRNISFIISSIDLSGNFNEIQYAINQKKNWSAVRENVLNLDVNGGEELLYLRSVGRNKSAIGSLTKIHIEKEKYYYQQYWFWLIFGGAVIGFLGFIRNRITLDRQKKFYEKELERQKLIQNERERISHDMHDDLGAGITAIRFQAEFLKRKLQEKQLKADVDDLLHTSEEIHKSMREMLWNLKSENDDLGHFVDYAEKYIINFFRKTDILARTEKSKINFVQPISSEARRNLFLCVKEALNNVLKHSNAKNVTVKFSQEDKTFKMTVTDDGKGIPKNHKKGNGLQNMQIRMQDIGGKLFIKNIGNGTQLIFFVPI